MTYLMGSMTVTTDTEGNVTFSQEYILKEYGSDVITATATDPGGNTSSFSLAVG